MVEMFGLKKPLPIETIDSAISMIITKSVLWWLPDSKWPVGIVRTGAPPGASKATLPSSLPWICSRWP